MRRTVVLGPLRALLVHVVVVCAGACSTGTLLPSDPACTLVAEGFGPAGDTALDVEVVVSGLRVPWSLAFVDDDTFLVTERGGTLRVVEAGVLREEPLVDLADVWAVSEAGLLGIALHPAFATNGFAYLYATLDEGSGPVNRILRSTIASDLSSATLDRVVLDDIPAFRVHDGGRMRFGSDGLLYVGTGDARSPDDSQNESSLAGKILRLTDEGEAAPDNPWGGRAFVKGLRNAQGIAFLDEETLVVTDHGPSGEVMGRTGHDEVNVATAGADLGWPDRYACEEQDGRTAPILTSTTAMPPGGVAVVDEASFAPWAGDIVTGTLGSKHLHRIVLDDERAVAEHETYLLGDAPDGMGRLRDVVNGPDGLYVTTSNCDGRGTCPPDTLDVVFRVRPGG